MGKLGTVQGSRSFKVIEVGTNRKPVCDFLSVINNNWHPISYRFQFIAAYFQILDIMRFWAPPPPLQGLETTYNVLLGLIGKHVVDFLLVLMELFSLGVTAEALWAKKDRKSAISLQRGLLIQNSRYKGSPQQSFLHGYLGQWMPYNFAADSFHTKKLCSTATLFKRSETLHRNWPFCRFRDPLWGN